jgi:lysozyme
MKITKLSQKGVDLIKQFEGLSLTPYVCAGGINTIGYGNTYYTNGKKVTLKDPKITQKQAEELLKHSLSTYEKAVDSFCRDDISQPQFDALVSFAYNVGTGNLQKSTLIKKVNANPKDVTIADEFLKWNKSAGRVLVGLTRRRQAEANLYFS